MPITRQVQPANYGQWLIVGIALFLVVAIALGKSIARTPSAFGTSLMVVWDLDTVNQETNFVGYVAEEVEIALYFDANSSQFSGEIRNVKGAALCDIELWFHLESAELDSRTKVENVRIAELEPHGKATVLTKVTSSFGSWQLRFARAAECEGVAVESGSLIEGDHSGTDEQIKRESMAESGTSKLSSSLNGLANDKEKSESGEAGSIPSVPLDQLVKGTLGDQNYSFAYDFESKTFRGTVMNPTDEVICASRTVIHLDINDNLLELGPTIPIDLSPGETTNIVMQVASRFGIEEGSYTLHLDTRPCDTNDVRD